MNSWLFFDVFLPSFCGIVAAASLYLLLNWVHARVLVSLNYRLEDLEGRVLREVKIRASEKSREGKNWDKDLLDKLQTEKPEPPLTMESWRNKKYKV